MTRVLIVYSKLHPVLSNYVRANLIYSNPLNLLLLFHCNFNVPPSPCAYVILPWEIAKLPLLLIVSGFNTNGKWVIGYQEQRLPKGYGYTLILLLYKNRIFLWLLSLISHEVEADTFCSLNDLRYWYLKE